MATVFEGRHPVLESRVALKLMHPGLAADPRAATRFLREAKAAAQLRHQHVVEVWDMGTEAGVPFIVMEFLDGADLAARIAEAGSLPLTTIASIFLPVASAVQAAHTAGIIHRDLKPANVMLAQRPPRAGQPVVLDFGISKLDDDLESLTRSGTVIGTLPYLAPELTNGARFASPASDQYSFSVMLYQCATGRLPFEGDGPYALMQAIVNAPLLPPSSLSAALPPEFDEIVLRGMQRDASRRFASMTELGAALLSFAPRAAFHLWSEQFGGRVAEVGGSEPLHTEPDIARPPATRQDAAPPPAARTTALPKSISLRAALLLGGYALLVTLALGLRWNSTRDSSALSQLLVAAVPRAPDLPVRSEPDAAVSSSVSPDSGDAASSASRAETPSGPAPSSGARTTEARPAEVRGARRSQRANRPEPSRADTEARAPETPADFGTNGAPIVE